MAAKKRGKGGRFVKGGKGPKKKRAPKASNGAKAVPISLLHKMDKTLTRIDHRLVPKRVKDRLHRIKGAHATAAQRRAEAAREARAAENDEARLAAKYG